MIMTSQKTPRTPYAMTRGRATRPLISISGAQRTLRPERKAIGFSWSGILPRR
jgi:hypothetical protein